MPLEVVLELYDYKVTDLVNKRKPQGGFKSVLELRDVLKNAALTPEQHKKFTECSAILAELVQDAIMRKTRVDSGGELPQEEAKPKTQTNDSEEVTDFNQDLVNVTGEVSGQTAEAVKPRAAQSSNTQKPDTQPQQEQVRKPNSVPPIQPLAEKLQATPVPETVDDFSFVVDMDSEPASKDVQASAIEVDDVKDNHREHSALHEQQHPDADLIAPISSAQMPVQNVSSIGNVGPVNQPQEVISARSVNEVGDEAVINAAIQSPVQESANNAPMVDEFAFLDELPKQNSQQVQDQKQEFVDDFDDDFDDFDDDGVDDFDAIISNVESASSVQKITEQTAVEVPSNSEDDFMLIDDFDLDDPQTTVPQVTSDASSNNNNEPLKSEASKPNAQQVSEVRPPQQKQEPSETQEPRETQEPSVKTYDDFDGLIDLDDEPEITEPLSATTLESGMLDLDGGKNTIATGLLQSAVEEDFMVLEDNAERAESKSVISQVQAVQSQKAEVDNSADDDFMLVDDFDLDEPLNESAADSQPATPQPVQAQPAAQVVPQVDDVNNAAINPNQVVPTNDLEAQENQVDIMQPRQYSQEDDFDDDALMVSGDGLFDDDFVKEVTKNRTKQEVEAEISRHPDNLSAAVNVEETKTQQHVEQVPEQAAKKQEEMPGFSGFDLDFSLDASDKAPAGTSEKVSTPDMAINLPEVGQSDSATQLNQENSQESSQEGHQESTEQASDIFGALGGIIMGGGDETAQDHKFSHLPSNNRRSNNFDFMPNELNSVVESISEAQQAEEEEELEHIRALAVKVWLYDLRRELDKLAFSFRFEPGRHTVRLIYSIMRNLQRYSKMPDFADDIELHNFNVIEAFPDYDNPLVPLRRLEDIRAVTDVFIQTIFSFKSRGSEYKHLNIPQEQVLPYLKKLAYLVAENPYAGKMTLIENKHPESQRIKEAIAMVEMDDIGFEAKRIERARLERKLAQALEAEESKSSMFKRDLRLYHDAVTNLFRWLYILLPSHVGGMATLPRLEGDIIASKNPSLKRYEQAKDSDAITLQLSGPVRCHLDSLEVAVIKTGNVWDLFCGEESTELSELTQIDASGRQIEAFVESDYLHLRVANKSRTLPQLLSEGLLLHWMIVEELFDDFATILKFITNVSASTSQLHMIRAIRQFIKLCEQSQNSLQAMMGFVNAARKSQETRLTNEHINEFFQKIELLLEARGSRLTKVLEFFGLEDSKLYLNEIVEKSQSMQFSGKAFKIRKLGDFSDPEQLLNTGFAMRTAHQLENDEMLMLSTPDGPIFVLDELSLYNIKRGHVLFAQSGMQVAGIFLPSKDSSTIEEL